MAGEYGSESQEMASLGQFLPFLRGASEWQSGSTNEPKQIMKHTLVLPILVLAATMLPLSPVHAAAPGTEKPKLPAIAEGPFKPEWDSLRQYQCPEWFRDAKFGIWAHWGAQCQPEMGDWYARNMYIEGSTDYKFHVANYGHPSVFGFKDVIHLWKADQFDPEKLIGLYKKAGAQYFVMMANHHCNFDNFDSKYQPWNSVNLGPKKDLVGMWEKAARQAGLRFGVTVHAARAWEWYEVSQLSDTNGPKAGVSYDGKLTKADGRGLWWDGLDPQELYAQNHKPNSDPVNRNNPNRIPGDRPSAAYCEKFFNRTIDLIDKYHPDLLYFDDGVLPLRGVSEDYGLNIAAHFYNANVKNHQGRLEAVMNTKGLNELQRQCLVWDIERGVSTRVEPFVWQTDTCIGSWHYQRAIYERHGYKTAEQVVHMLLDIVSKNGNLLLNIPVRGNGTIDEDEVKFLEDLAAWMAVNSECIFGTRPWKIFGEGASATEAPETGRFGGASDVRKKGYTSADFRFTTKGGALYAAALAWPTDGKLTLHTLAAGADGIRGDATQVELLGRKEKLAFKRDATGLVVTLPAQKPCEHAFVLKISGFDLAASAPKLPKAASPAPIPAAVNGTLTLSADRAEVHGSRLKAQTKGGEPNLGGWDNFTEFASWTTQIAKPGRYAVVARASSARKENQFTIEIGAQKLTGQIPKTASWADFVEVKITTVDLPSAGPLAVQVRPGGASASWRAINLATIRLIPTE
jgi:alpha-L-fucosidase